MGIFHLEMVAIEFLADLLAILVESKWLDQGVLDWNATRMQ